jgi:hypothetical protein
MSGAAEALAPGAAAAAPAAAAAAAPAAGASPVTWLGENPDPVAVGYVQNKGWKDPGELLTGYRNLEKLVGENRIAVPKDEKDEAAWGKLYDSMGRPKTHADYKLPVPQGGDPKFAGAAAEVFHKAGLSSKQASTIATWWNELAAKGQKDADTARETRQAQELDAVKTEWGGAYDERLATGQRAMRTFGVDAETATKLEGAMGSKWLMNFMFTIGHALTEHKTEGADGAPGKLGALTPQQAMAEIARLKADVEWGKKYTNGDVEARARMEQLHKWAYPS